MTKPRPKDAVVRLRCSSDLKTRLEAQASRREQQLSDYLRTTLIDLVNAIEREQVAEDQALYNPGADPPAKTRKAGVGPDRPFSKSA